jgi:hypothetical protein
MSSDEKILAIMMLEILGRPPEHITETFKQLIKKISEEKGVVLKGERVNEPKKIEGQEELYTSFAELEIEAESLQVLSGLMFMYMPSYMEIITPEKLTLTNNSINEFLNETTRRLHAYDEVARVIQNERVILEKKLKDILEKEKK